MTSSEGNIKKYKFNENLLKASSNKTDVEQAKEEWRLIIKKTEPTNDNLCICQRKVKHINYLYNIKTQHTIICGSKCCKTFNFGTKQLNNTKLSYILMSNLERGEYENIDNILVYSNTIKEQLIKIYLLNYKQKINNMFKLEELLDEIKEIIAEYNIDYLQDIQNTISKTIQQLNKEEKHKTYQSVKQIEELNLKLQLIKEQEAKEQEQRLILKNIIAQHNIIIWTCKFCQIAEPKTNKTFFSIDTCLVCANNKQYSLAY